MAGSWEIVQPAGDKVLVGIPNVDHTTVSWAISLRSLQIPQGTAFYGPTHYMIDGVRNMIAAMAIERKVDYLFFIDSDTEVPPDAYNKLRALNHPVVAGLYHRRHPPYNPCVWKDVKPGEDTITPVADIKPNDIFDAELFGLGCCLIHVPSTLAKMSAPWFKWTLDTLPKPEGCSEDFYFLRRIRKELGIMPKLHAGVRCQHNGIVAVRPKDDGGTQICGLSG